MKFFEKYFNSFNSFKKDVEKKETLPKYVKPDGTKIYEQENEFGLFVYEISPDCTVISRSYDKNGNMFFDWIRRRNLEIAHLYNESKKIVYEYNFLYDEKNILRKKIETLYEYNDEGKKIKETVITTPSNLKVEKYYDDKENLFETIEFKGSVKTWYDKDGNAYKRVIDKGSGGIIEEDL